MANAPSTKRLQIDKTNARIVIFVSVAAFIVMFSLIATKTFISQAGYQNRVISAKRATVNKLKSNIAATKQLKSAYNEFNGEQKNVIGGESAGSAQRDGTNSKIVLDALPSSYDFPGLTTSLESLLQSQNVSISSISGTDDELSQGTNQTSATPTSVPIPFQTSVTGDYTGIQSVVDAFQRSIRPIQIKSLTISGGDKINLNVTAQTYYQPAKSLNITKKTIQ